MYVLVLRRLYNPCDVDASLYFGCRQELMSRQSGGTALDAVVACTLLSSFEFG